MRFVLLVLLLLWSGSTLAQKNYVLNPAFEQFSTCPVTYDDMTFAKYWSGVDSLGHNSCVPDYCNICASNVSPVQVPDGDKAYQYPRSGQGFAQVVMFSSDSGIAPYQRDYLQGRLYKKLIGGKSYCVTFYVNLAEASVHAIKDIGAYFDNGVIDTTKNCGLPQTKYIPQVTNAGGIISDTLNWIKIEGSFVANGTEKFITIGNFRDKAHTTYINLPYNGRNTSGYWTGYLVDDVSVVESDLAADAGTDRHIGRGDSTYIGRPTEVGLECTWNVLGSSTVLDTGAGLWVRPSTTTSYVVTQTLCGNTKKDTVRVEVWGVGVNGVSGKRGVDYSLSPNPNNGSFDVIQSFPVNESLDANVFDILGRTVTTTNLRFVEGKARITLDGLIPGLYILKIDDPFVKVIRFEVK